MNAGLGDAADEQHLGQPVRARQRRDDGHAGQRHARRSRASRPWSCRSPATAATAVRRDRPAPPLPHVHRRADGRELQRRRPDLVALDRRPVHRQLPGVAALLRAGDLRPGRTKTIFVGAQRVWRTQNAGGDRAFLEAHCNTRRSASSRATCSTRARAATPADWPPLGTSTLTNSAATSRHDEERQHLSSLARAQDAGTLWAAPAPAAS